MGLSRRLIESFVCGVLFLGAVTAARADAASGLAHPALWRIENGFHQVYVFGSFHILKKGVSWVTPTIVAAMEKADAFVFEVPVTEKAPMADAQDYIDKQGYLPEGKTLSGMLSEQGLQAYQAVLAKLPLRPGEMDKLHPWLAQLTLTSSFYDGQSLSVINGADVRILGYAVGHRKPVRYLETPRQQLEFFAESAGDFEVTSFESMVESLRDTPSSIDSATAAWVSGDVDGLSMGLQHALERNPMAKKILLDDRNAAWAQEIEQMLSDSKTYFVTVGVGHLGGPGSVFEILCSKGYKIERLPTANEAVDPACPK